MADPAQGAFGRGLAGVGPTPQGTPRSPGAIPGTPDGDAAARDSVAGIFGENDPKAQLRAQGLTYMLTGAAWAAAVAIGALIFVLVFVGLGRLLPEESKQAPDPSPDLTSIEVVRTLV